MAKAAKLVGFIETMDCLSVPEVPDGPEWTYEIKLDGFRVEAVKQGGKVTLYSRRGNILNAKFPYIATALKALPEETILDGELVALDGKGRSVFNLLQNFRSAEAQIHYYAFDIQAVAWQIMWRRSLQVIWRGAGLKGSSLTDHQTVTRGLDDFSGDSV